MRRNLNPNPDGTLLQVHIADIHFGSIDPSVTYSILTEQFIKPISMINFDLLCIDGDLFDKKFLASSPAVDYANRFINDLANLCSIKGATMILLGGTKSHDADQLSMFYGYMQSDAVDFRVVEHLGFEYVKGYKILCIPEEYGRPQNDYVNAFCEVYDLCILHGTVVGSVYGANKYVLESRKAPVFSLDCFGSCRGPVIAGHVHKAACYGGNTYYVSNPIRYKFGEEEDKGYAIVVQGPYGHYYKFMEIESFQYHTVNLSSIVYNDPSDVVRYLNNLKLAGVDYIRLNVDINDQQTQQLVEKAYLADKRITIKRYTETSHSVEDIVEETGNSKYSEFGFLFDNNTDGYTKFVNFINYNEGKPIITVDQLKKLLSGADLKDIIVF